MRYVSQKWLLNLDSIIDGYDLGHFRSFWGHTAMKYKCTPPIFNSNPGLESRFDINQLSVTHSKNKISKVVILTWNVKGYDL